MLTKPKLVVLKMNNKMLDRTFTKTEVSRSLPTKEDKEAIDEVAHAPNLAAQRNHLLKTSASIRQLLLWALKSTAPWTASLNLTPRMNS